MNKPNIVFVLTDDQGYPPLGCHGHPFVVTPNIDQFSTNSINFKQFHSGTTCAPTRAGLLTGHYCNSTGVWHTIGGRSLLRNNEWTLANALSENGYETGIFGKWHLGDEYPYRPQDRGFKKTICHGGGGISQQPDWWGNDYFDDTYYVDGIPKEFKGYCTDVFFEEAMKFIVENKENPFFCFVSTNAPHSPFNIGKKYRDLYKNKTHDSKYARFLGMITNIDENFGKIYELICSLDLIENTILIFMSDNGQTNDFVNAYNCEMRGFKGSEYEGGHRIPFMLQFKKLNYTEQINISELTSYVDFMPTILELCNINIPKEVTFHGKSLISLIEKSNKEFWKSRIIVTDTQRVSDPIKWKNSCVMKDQWRLVNKFELYNLKNDPSQLNNLFNDHPDLVLEMQNAYDDWWKICSTQMNDGIPISIGSDCQDTVVLRTHDLINTNVNSDTVWNQFHVRNGKISLGYWEIFVENAGYYKFQLRRWPEESTGRIQAKLDRDVKFEEDDVDPSSKQWYSGSMLLNFDTATLYIDNFSPLSTDIVHDDEAAEFKIFLTNGYTKIRGYFYSSSQKIYMSPYYVYVSKFK